MSDKPYNIYITKHKFDVSLPDKDGDIQIDFNAEIERVYLSKEDVLKLLERFD